MTQDKWHDAAWHLFGYSVGCQQNMDEIARALAEIDSILRCHDDVRVEVQERRDEDQPGPNSEQK